ncbi:hypothetical protein N7449_011155 [Penicillium cf. viridicatum]|uniref:Uncharacterized protein n=1 Tax=Penicillium cf. viridicatum TaxID=2972119 RepID=A0A9W9J2L9_9EURO|nr:hypothetical protein N7449_011155 [Penicillium cf. viridicatum]
MSEVRDHILAEHSWTLVSTLRCRELYQSHSDKSILMSHNENNTIRRMISHTLLLSNEGPPKMALAGGPPLYARFSPEGYSDPVQITSSSARIPQRMGPHPPLSESEQAIMKVLGQFEHFNKVRWKCDENLDKTVSLVHQGTWSDDTHESRADSSSKGSSRSRRSTKRRRVIHPRIKRKKSNKKIQTAEVDQSEEMLSDEEALWKMSPDDHILIDSHPIEGQDGVKGVSGNQTSSGGADASTSVGQTPTTPKRNQQDAGIGRENYPTQPTARTVRGNTSRPSQKVSTPNEAEAEEPTSDHQLAPVETDSGTTEPSEPAIEMTGALLPEDEHPRRGSRGRSPSIIGPTTHLESVQEDCDDHMDYERHWIE